MFPEGWFTLYQMNEITEGPCVSISVKLYHRLTAVLRKDTLDLLGRYPDLLVRYILTSTQNCLTTLLSLQSHKNGKDLDYQPLFI